MSKRVRETERNPNSPGQQAQLPEEEQPTLNRRRLSTQHSQVVEISPARLTISETKVFHILSNGNQYSITKVKGSRARVVRPESYEATFTNTRSEDREILRVVTEARRGNRPAQVLSSSNIIYYGEVVDAVVNEANVACRDTLVDWETPQSYTPRGLEQGNERSEESSVVDTEVRGFADSDIFEWIDIVEDFREARNELSDEEIIVVENGTQESDKSTEEC